MAKKTSTVSSLARARRSGDAVLVIGLGRFGSATAAQLHKLNREVLAVDTRMELVQQWAEHLTHVVQADVTSGDALRQIGADKFSTAVVAVGSSIEASVLITANLVDLGVKEIWAKAISKAHGTILERIGATHVIYPEAEAGERVAHLLSGTMLDFVEIDNDFVISRMIAPTVLVGQTLATAGLRRDFRVTVVGVKKEGSSFTYSTAETRIDAGDQIIVSGAPADVERFAATNR